MMKNRLLQLLFCLTVISVSAEKSEQNIKIKNTHVEKIGEQLRIRFTAEIPKNAVSRNDKLTLLPVISKDGLSKDLPPIVVESRRSKIVALDATVVRTSNGNTVEYETTILYQKWMNGSMLRIDRRLTGCCTEKMLRSESLARNMKFAWEFNPNATFEWYGWHNAGH